jgi:UDP:flavonoid glycosyltransferase YjiC (YdhE family)
MKALADEDVLVVVTGGRPLGSLPPPANARAAEYLPYNDLLPNTAAFVTNAGYVAVQYALRQGVPVVVCGSQEAKPEVAARGPWADVGRRLAGVPPRPADVRHAVRAVLRDARYRNAAEAMAKQIALSGELQALAAVVNATSGTALRPDAQGTRLAASVALVGIRRKR